MYPRSIINLGQEELNIFCINNSDFELAIISIKLLLLILLILHHSRYNFQYLHIKHTEAVSAINLAFLRRTALSAQTSLSRPASPSAMITFTRITSIVVVVIIIVTTIGVVWGIVVTNSSRTPLVGASPRVPNPRRSDHLKHSLSK